MSQQLIARLKERPVYGVTPVLPPGVVRSAIRQAAGGLALGLGGAARLLDGTAIDPDAIYGTAWFGPYPFAASETNYGYRRFRLSAPIVGGAGVLNVGDLTAPLINSEGWTNRGNVAVRLDLREAAAGIDRPLGSYEFETSFVHNEQGYTPVATVLEGPYLSGVSSDDPSQAVVSFSTTAPTAATLQLDDGRSFQSPQSNHHAVRLGDLNAERDYSYDVRMGSTVFGPFHFRTPGFAHEAATVRFAFMAAGGKGLAAQELPVAESEVVESLAGIAYGQGAQFLLVGGSVVGGPTTSVDDYVARMQASKRALRGFWNQRPVLTIMGGNPLLVRAFEDQQAATITLDRWPYATESTEALFAGAFANPMGGPVPSDPRRPPYAGTAYSMQYGPLRLIVFNTNYWFSAAAEQTGGSPPGYLLEDQLQWIEGQLSAAEVDRRVGCVVLAGHEAIFPQAGGVAGAMWYQGNNKVRAYTTAADRLQAEPLGIVEVRNRLATAIGNASKVAAVLSSGEPAYYRLLIDRNVPVGLPERDDRNADGLIDWTGGETASPLANLRYGTWYIGCGGAGGGYEAEQPAPWNRFWRSRPATAQRQSYRYSPQESIVLLEVARQQVSLRAINRYGEIIDEVADLTSARR